MKMLRPGSVPIAVAAAALAAAMAAGLDPRLFRSPSGRRGRPAPVGVRRIGAPPPGSILRRLSQRAPRHRGGRGRVRAGFAAPRNGSRTRLGGPGAAERRRGAVGAGDREARRRLDAAGGAPATRRGGGALGHELAGDAHRPGGRGEPESGPNRFDASPEPHRVRQRDSRPPRSGDRRNGAAARRRDIGYRVRQQRGGPLDIDRATGALSVCRTEDLAPGHRCHHGARFRALRELRAADPGGPAQRGPAARIPRRPLRHAPFSGRRQLHLPHRADDQLAGLRPRHGQKEPARPPHRRQARPAVHGGGRGAGHAGSHDLVAGRGGRPRMGAVRPRVGRPPGGPRARRRRTARRRGLFRPQPLGARGSAAAGDEGSGPVERREVPRERGGPGADDRRPLRGRGSRGHAEPAENLRVRSRRRAGGGGVRRADPVAAGPPRLSPAAGGSRRRYAAGILPGRAGEGGGRLRQRHPARARTAARRSRLPPARARGSAPGRRRDRRTRWATWSWRRACRSSCGAAFPTTSCSTSPSATS